MNQQQLQLPNIALYLTRWIDVKWLILLTVVFTIFVTAIDSTQLFILLPTLAETFDTDASIIIWVGMSHLVVSGGLLLIFGRLGDTGGKSQLFILGTVIFAIGYSLAPLSTSIYMLITIRLFVGIGYALVMSNRDALLTMTFAQKQKGIAIGLQGIGLGLGLALGPFLAGIVIEIWGWQAVFLCIAPVAWLAVLLCFALLPRDGTISMSNVNIYQAISLFLILSSTIIALNQSARIGIAHPLTLSSIITGLVSLVTFILLQKKVLHPVIDFSLFKSSVYSLGLTVLLAMYLVSNAATAITPFLLIHGLGYSATKTGMLSSLLHGIRPICSPVTGWLWTRITSNSLWLVGNITLIAGVFISGFAESTTDPTFMIFIGFTLIGWGTAMIETTSGSIILATTDNSRLGSASASVATFRQVGLALGSTFGMAMFVLLSARMADIPASSLTPHTIATSILVSAINNTLFVCGSISILVTVIMLRYWKSLNKEIYSLLLHMKNLPHR